MATTGLICGISMGAAVRPPKTNATAMESPATTTYTTDFISDLPTKKVPHLARRAIRSVTRAQERTTVFLRRHPPRIVQKRTRGRRCAKPQILHCGWSLFLILILARSAQGPAGVGPGHATTVHRHRATLRSRGSGTWGSERQRDIGHLTNVCARESR